MEEINSMRQRSEIISLDLGENNITYVGAKALFGALKVNQ